MEKYVTDGQSHHKTHTQRSLRVAIFREAVMCPLIICVGQHPAPLRGAQGPWWFQRNAVLNRTCRLNGLQRMCVCARNTETNITTAIMAVIQKQAAPVSGRSPALKGSLLIGPRGGGVYVWGEVSISVITLGAVRLTPPVSTLLPSPGRIGYEPHANICAPLAQPGPTVFTPFPKTLRYITSLLSRVAKRWKIQSFSELQ